MYSEDVETVEDLKEYLKYLSDQALTRKIEIDGLAGMYLQGEVDAYNKIIKIIEEQL